MIRSIFLSVALVVVAAVPASAGSYDWPGDCPANPYGTKHALRTMSANDWTGQKRRECGNFWKSGDHGLRDSNFGSSSGDGTINNANDSTRSLVLMNKSSKGVCMTFYEDRDYSAGHFPKNKASVWVHPREDYMKYSMVRVKDMWGGWVSSAKAWRPDDQGHDTLAECLAEQGGIPVGPSPVYQWGHKTKDGSVIWY